MPYHNVNESPSVPTHAQEQGRSNAPAQASACRAGERPAAALLRRLAARTLFSLVLATATWTACAAYAEGEAGGYSLDMRDTDISEFIATIGKLTGKTIVMDPRVKGKVTISSPKAVTKEELYEIFLVQLGVNGFSVVDVGDHILKVIPQQAVKMEGVNVQGDGSASPGSSENIVTRVVRVKNVDVAALVPVLRPLVDDGSGIIAPYPDSNVILITDREANVRRLLDIIVRVDKADTEDTEIIPLENASAQEVSETLSTLLREEGGKSGGGNGQQSASQITADSRTNSLLIRGNEARRDYLRKIIRRLDGEVRTDNNTRVYYLKYAKAADLANVLESISGTLSDDDEGGEQRAPNGESIHIKAHESTNSIVLSGSPGVINRLTQLIEQLDIRRAQVMVEAIIVEMSESRAKELGVQWLFGDRSDGNRLSVAGTNFNNLGNGLNALLTGDAEARGARLSATEGLSAGIGRIDASGLNFGVLLKALQDDGETNILSTPSLVTMDNEEASILVGSEVPIITGQTIGDNNSNPFQTIERQDVGIKLNITPQVNDGSAVQLKILQEVSSLTRVSTAADIITDKREIRTSVMVDDGATIVLGGLIDDDVQEQQSKVPLLGDLPVVGRLFRSDSSQISRRNLMVFIRPTIIRDRDTLTEVSSAKYSYIRDRQKPGDNSSVNLFPDEAPRVLPEWTGMGPASLDLLPPGE